MPHALPIIAASYLLGSIPFGYLLVRIFRGEDVRQSGSGNIGATNVSRKSPALGILTLVLDALKGSAAVALSIILSPAVFGRFPVADVPWREVLPASVSPQLAPWAALAALCAILGHMFPVWLKFRGGKGVATGLGAFAMIAPWAVLSCGAIFIAVVFLSRYVSLASIVAVALFPTITWTLREFGARWQALAFISLSSLAIVVKHHENIHRLLTGRENRIGSKQAAQQGNR
ncbi:MAG TPA: glycerol-3-phosphate 1-O-acyltransferase PlsY [Candidatus Sulfotelmatobacter sp.]|nr:glycerol-3-phosphate 1-O-acyltransferase PlsY [Candidatus Sulfotelmatobacter sp.]